MTSPFQALCFDFNGVIVDDEPIHFEAFRRTFAGIGITLTREEYWSRLLAFDDRGVVAAMEAEHAAAFGFHGCSAEALLDIKIRHYLELVGAEPPFFPAAIETVRALAGKFRMCVVSGARRIEIESMLAAGGIANCFEFIVASGETPASKPAPDPYRRAVDLLGIPPARAAAIEDSVGGVASAKAAGVYTVAVTHTYPREKLADADAVFESLSEVGVALLKGA